jgi:hypothetical protein
VFLLNLALAALALTAVATGGVLVPVLALGGAAALVAMLLASFSHVKPKG